MRYLKNTIKSKLRDNELVFGSWLNIPSLEVTEIMAKSGFEFLVIDTEHSSINLETVQKMMTIIEGYNVFPFVRVEENNPTAIKKALETGCYGVIVPMVNTKGNAQRAIDNVYYNPKGTRGVGLSRAQGYGLEFDRYKKWYKNNISLIVQIENIEAVDNLENILSLKEIDTTIIGPYDLSASLGYPGKFNRKEVKDALVRYERVSKQYNKPYGYHIVHPDKKLLKEKIKNGYKFIAYGIDQIFLAEKCRDEIKNIKGVVKT